jgi:hypothetical protein
MLKRLPLAVLLIAMSAPALVRADVRRVQFTGFLEGEVVRDQYMFWGMRIAPDDRGGPYWDDAASFSFLMDSPPGVLNLNPLTIDSGPGRVHASVGTYVFDMVDPTNPFVPSFTDYAQVMMIFIDAGETVLRAYGAGGELLATDTLSLNTFSFTPIPVTVSAPGIQRFTVTTPLPGPSIGACVDTVSFETPAVLPARPIEIDVRPGMERNSIRLRDSGFVTVAILSSPGFDPSVLDVNKILFQGALPGRFLLTDRNRDRVPDLLLDFKIGNLQQLTTATTEAFLTAVDVDGTSLKGSDNVLVISGPTPPRSSLPSGTGMRAGGSSGGRLMQQSQ